jgi:hypothetical protein
MPLPDPDSKPREFLTLILAAALLVFSEKTNGPVDAFVRAGDFIDEAEKRMGPLNP